MLCSEREIRMYYIHFQYRAMIGLYLYFSAFLFFSIRVVRVFQLLFLMCWKWFSSMIKCIYHCTGRETQTMTTLEFGSKLWCTEKSRNRLWSTIPLRWLPLLKSKLLATHTGFFFFFFISIWKYYFQLIFFMIKIVGAGFGIQ